MAHYGYGPRFPYPWAMCSKLMIACRTVSLPEAACLSLPGTRGIRAAIPHARRNSSLGLHGGCGWSALCKDARDVGIRFSSTPKLCQTSACLHVRCDDTRPVRCHEMIGLNAVRRVHSSLLVARPRPLRCAFLPGDLAARVVWVFGFPWGRDVMSCVVPRSFAASGVADGSRKQDNHHI